MWKHFQSLIKWYCFHLYHHRIWLASRSHHSYTSRQGRFSLFLNILFLDFPGGSSHFLIVYSYFYFVLLQWYWWSLRKSGLWLFWYANLWSCSVQFGFVQENEKRKQKKEIHRKKKCIGFIYTVDKFHLFQTQYTKEYI